MEAVEQWEAYAQQQPMTVWCGADLHGLLPLRENMLGYMTLVSTEKELSQNPVEAADQMRHALMHGVCVNQLAGFVDGLSLTDTDGNITARAQMHGEILPGKRTTCVASAPR